MQSICTVLLSAITLCLQTASRSWPVSPADEGTTESFRKEFDRNTPAQLRVVCLIHIAAHYEIWRRILSDNTHVAHSFEIGNQKREKESQWTCNRYLVHWRLGGRQQNPHVR